MKNEHAKFTSAIECQQMATTSHCELHGFRKILLKVFIIKTIVVIERFLGFFFLFN